MPGKKILWLCSWYPDNLHPYNGDFIQRHARAASLFNDIYVIHIVSDPGIKTRSEGFFRENNGVKERIVYYQKPGGLLKRFRSFFRWQSIYREAVNMYIREYGKPDLVHVHVPMPDGMMALKLKKKYKLPYFVTEHWTIYQPENELKYEHRQPLFRSIIKKVIARSDHLLPVSKNLGLLLNQLVVSKEFTVVENVADDSLFNLTAGSNNENFRFIHVSTLSYQKNAEALLESFLEFQKTHRDCELVIVGPAPEKFINQVAASGLMDTHLFLRGEISYESVAAEMKDADAFVLFSRFENSPCSIIEALCCGLPVIATDVGGIAELVNPTNGVLVKPLDNEGLKQAFKTVKENYPVYDRQMISTKARERFNYRTIGKKLDDLYTRFVKPG